MKKIIKTIMMAALTLCMFTGCSNQNQEVSVNLNDVMTTMQEQLIPEELTLLDSKTEYLSAMYNYDLIDGQYVQMVGKYPMMSAQTYEIMMFEANDTVAADNLEKAMNEKVETTLNGFGYPSTMEAAENAVVTRQGNYVALFMAYDMDNAEINQDLANIFTSYFTEK